MALLDLCNLCSPEVVDELLLFKTRVLNLYVHGSDNVAKNVEKAPTVLAVRYSRDLQVTESMGITRCITRCIM